MGESFRQKRATKEQWDKYHKTKKMLVDAIELHKNSIETVNPYTHFNDGSWEMTNEYMGLYDMNKLFKRVAPIEKEPLL